MTGTRDKSSAAKAPVTKATAKAGKSGTTTGGGATTGKASGSRATPATVQKSTGGRASLSGRGSRARTLVVPETPLDAMAGGGAAGRRPTAVVQPAAFFAVVPRPVMIRGGKVDRSMKSPPELGDVGLLGAERAERQGGG